METHSIRSEDVDHTRKVFKEDKMYPEINKDKEVKTDKVEKKVEEEVEAPEPEIDLIEEDEKSSEETKKPIVTPVSDMYQQPHSNENNDIAIIPKVVAAPRSSKCCKSFEESVRGCKPLYWYLGPATFEIGSSVSCFFYHWFNFGLAVAIWSFLVGAISGCVPLIILACIGIPLLYLAFEVTLFMGRIQFYLNYYMVERDPLLLGSEKWRLRLTLDNKNLPKCGTICEEGGRLNRIKFLCSNLNMYGIILYDLILNPIVVFVAGFSTVVVMFCVNLLVTPFWYAGAKGYFKNGHVCVFDCQVWKLNSVEDVILAFFVGLLLLPLSFRLCNYMAYLSKCVNYWVLTDYYKNSRNNDNSGKNLLNNNNKNSNNNHGSINDEVNVVIKTTDEVGVISGELKDINDGGNTNEQQTTQKSLYDQL